MSYLSINNIEVIYDHVILVLKGVSLQVPQGKIVALLGANGAGKSTTLKSISNLLRAERGDVTKGSVEFKGQRIDQLTPADLVKKGDLIAKWDPFNAVIVTEAAGKIDFESVIENVTYKVESDEATGLREIIITESKDKTKIPSLHILDENGGIIRTYNLPVGGHVVVEDKQTVKSGDILVKIPRAVGKAGDITGGLPRVTELFEARNPSNPAVVSEIDGEITMGKIKRGNREIIVTSKTGDVRKYLVALSKQILVQENDYVRAGTPLSDGAIPIRAKATSISFSSIFLSFASP